MHSGEQNPYNLKQEQFNLMQLDFVQLHVVYVFSSALVSSNNFDLSSVFISAYSLQKEIESLCNMDRHSSSESKFI